jgi:hypothetical protein
MSSYETDSATDRPRGKRKWEERIHRNLELSEIRGPKFGFLQEPPKVSRPALTDITPLSWSTARKYNVNMTTLLLMTSSLVIAVRLWCVSFENDRMDFQKISCELYEIGGYLKLILFRYLRSITPTWLMPWCHYTLTTVSTDDVIARDATYRWPYELSVLQ